MKSSSLTVNGIYATKKGSYASVRPALVLDKKNWVSREQWVDSPTGGPRLKTRVYTPAEKGDRASAGSYRSSTEVGIPVLRISKDGYYWSETTDSNLRIVDQPDVILQKARLAMNTDAVFSTGEGSMSTSAAIAVRTFDGELDTVSVHLEFFRPQSFIASWADHVEEARKLSLKKVEWEMAKAERQAKSNATSQDIMSRVSKLVDHPNNYTLSGERYDLRRKAGSTTTYEVSEEMLLKLLALAEKGSDQ